MDELDRSKLSLIKGRRTSRMNQNTATEEAASSLAKLETEASASVFDERRRMTEVRNLALRDEEKSSIMHMKESLANDSVIYNQRKMKGLMPTKQIDKVHVSDRKISDLTDASECPPNQVSKITQKNQSVVDTRPPVVSKKMAVKWTCNDCQVACIPVRSESRCLW
jgi:hypothetical protein